MYRTMLKSKIHRAVVTGSDLNYEGSIAIDTALCTAADLVEFEKVDIYNINTGARFSTYVIPGAPGEISLNGAAARLVQPGDRIIIASYVQLSEAERLNFEPKIVLVDDDNRPYKPADKRQITPAV
ncbi:MAG: aspartate 1-decarboxylase [Cyclobacteriaceae bacterium]|nr:aspartate 1-decarboxylase [Cyclobacteriaceae bacterium]MCX7637002.1 aspartate 1-decarboxylase [Cyclobacteriaceae bacterium]MDW8330125.1 aspartate 1-decarboxylase [Cyclobacteriaceae bacterium]